MSYTPLKITLKSGSVIQCAKPESKVQVTMDPSEEQGFGHENEESSTTSPSKPSESTTVQTQADAAVNQIIQVIDNAMEHQSVTRENIASNRKLIESTCTSMNLSLICFPDESGELNLQTTKDNIKSTSDTLTKATLQINDLLGQLATTDLQHGLNLDEFCDPVDEADDSDDTVIMDRLTTKAKGSNMKFNTTQPHTSIQTVRPTRSSNLGRFTCDSCYQTMFGSPAAQSHEDTCTSKPAQIRKNIAAHEVPSSESSSSNEVYRPGKDLEEAFEY